MDDDEIELIIEGDDIDPLAVADALYALDKLMRNIGDGGPVKLTSMRLEA